MRGCGWLMYARRSSRLMISDKTCDRKISDSTERRNLPSVWAMHKERNTQPPVSVTAVEGVFGHQRLAVPGHPATANGVSTKGENASGTQESELGLPSAKQTFCFRTRAIDSLRGRVGLSSVTRPNGSTRLPAFYVHFRISCAAMPHYADSSIRLYRYLNSFHITVLPMLSSRAFLFFLSK